MVDGLTLGYEYKIEPEIRGVKITLSGFNDKFYVLLENII